MIIKKTNGTKPARKAQVKIGDKLNKMIKEAMIETMHLKNIDTFVDKLFSITSVSEFNLETKAKIICGGF